MIRLYDQYHQDFAYGYKVVYKKKNKYYSLVMGFEYVNGELIPDVKTQNDLTQGFFVNTLLNEYDICHNKMMRGRTSLFMVINDAISLYNNLCYWMYKSNRKHLRLVYCRVDEDVMSDTYSSSFVVAGRRLTIIKEGINE